MTIPTSSPDSWVQGFQGYGDGPYLQIADFLCARSRLLRGRLKQGFQGYGITLSIKIGLHSLAGTAQAKTFFEYILRACPLIPKTPLPTSTYHRLLPCGTYAGRKLFCLPRVVIQSAKASHKRFYR